MPSSFTILMTDMRASGTAVVNITVPFITALVAVSYLFAMDGSTVIWLFIFPLGMGLKGAAVASGLGQVLSFMILLSHFVRKKGQLS